MPASRLLAVLTSDPDGPVVRHRWRAYEGDLARAGIVLEVVPWPKRRAGRRFALQRASAADGVVLSSRLLTLRDTRRLRRRARRLAFDFDDALPFRDSRRGAKRSATRGRRFKAIVTRADRVFAGNEYLRGLAAEAGAEAAVLPTTVHVRPGPPSPEPPGDMLTLGWIGSSATLPYLEDRALMLSALVASGHSFRVRVIADRAPAFPPGIVVETVAWRPETWEDALAGIHVGFAPLPDDAWTRGKCGLKVLQMLAQGRPVVASAVGVQARMIRHEETGMLGTDPASLLAGLVALLEDGAMRRRLGAAGREAVRADWSDRAWAPRVVAAIEELLA